MGFALAFVAMACFSANILLSRYAVARLGIEAGFFVVLAVNVTFSAALFGLEAAARAGSFAWDWRGVGLFALAGVIGTFLGRRLLFDTVRLLGPARASVVHSSAPAFTLVAAWVLVQERLGVYEIVLMVIVWVGLWFTAPAPGGSAPQTLAPDALRKGALIGIATVAGFGISNAIRGLAMRDWPEAVFGTFVSSCAALACQIAATRDWRRVADQFRGTDRRGVALYMGSGVATALGSIFVTLAMAHVEIALAVLVTHTTPLVIFPVSVFVLKNREGLTARTLLGALLVLAGVALLMLR
jgi:drug/metabolite transporter (DMT)-like permease